jgi:hypothetical protein
MVRTTLEKRKPVSWRISLRCSIRDIHQFDQETTYAPDKVLPSDDRRIPSPLHCAGGEFGIAAGLRDDAEQRVLTRDTSVIHRGA